MKVHLPEQQEPGFQMAPMIDMVFLLLVFFMCASHLSQRRNIPLEIPLASHAVVPEERTDRWVVNVTRSGELYSGETQTSLDELALRLRQELAQNPAVTVYLRSDADCEHGKVKRVMDRLAEVGIGDFVFGVHVPSADQEGGQ